MNYKTLMNKEEFLKTDYGKLLQADVRNLDYYIRRRKKLPDDVDTKLWNYVYRSKFQVHTAVLKQFYGIDCEYFSDDEGYGIREESGEVLFRASRKIVLSYLGKDDWYRAVYVSDSGQIMKTAEPFRDEWALDLEMVMLRGLYSSSGNSFDGEPDCHIKEDLEIEIKDGRKS